VIFFQFVIFVNERGRLVFAFAQVDEALLLDDTLTLNKRHAVIVRLGEKKVLKGAMDRIQRLLLLSEEKEKQNGKNLKRKGRDSESMEGARRSKR
jgi:N-lysine methyltransferase SETD6